MLNKIFVTFNVEEPNVAINQVKAIHGSFHIVQFDIKNSKNIYNFVLARVQAIFIFILKMPGTNHSNCTRCFVFLSSLSTFKRYFCAQ